MFYNMLPTQGTTINWSNFVGSKEQVAKGMGHGEGRPEHEEGRKETGEKDPKTGERKNGESVKCVQKGIYQTVKFTT